MVYYAIYRKTHSRVDSHISSIWIPIHRPVGTNHPWPDKARPGSVVPITGKSVVPPQEDQNIYRFDPLMPKQLCLIEVMQSKRRTGEVKDQVWTCAGLVETIKHACINHCLRAPIHSFSYHDFQGPRVLRWGVLVIAWAPQHSTQYIEAVLPRLKGRRDLDLDSCDPVPL